MTWLLIVLVCLVLLMIVASTPRGGARMVNPNHRPAGPPPDVRT